jgi:hypothetical protein
MPKVESSFKTYKKKGEVIKDLAEGKVPIPIVAFDYGAFLELCSRKRGQTKYQ